VQRHIALLPPRVGTMLHALHVATGLLTPCPLAANALCSACAELKIPVLCLELIRLLWSKLRSELKMQVEALFNGVFYHTLHWCLANLDVNNPDWDDAASARGASAQADDKPAVLVDAALDEFSGEMLSKGRLFNVSFEILDCLVDLLAEATLLPDLYVNYDCDGNRCDLTQTLFELLSQVVQQSHVACFESHEESHFLWAQAVGEIALRGMFNALYVVHLRTHPDTLVVAGDRSNGPSDEEINEDTLLVDQEGRSPPAETEEFASAEVLFKSSFSTAFRSSIGSRWQASSICSKTYFCLRRSTACRLRHSCGLCPKA